MTVVALFLFQLDRMFFWSPDASSPPMKFVAFCPRVLFFFFKCHRVPATKVQ